MEAGRPGKLEEGWARGLAEDEWKRFVWTEKKNGNRELMGRWDIGSNEKIGKV